MKQGRRSHVKSEGAKGGYFFSCNFLLLFWAIWKNDLFSKSQKVGGLKPPLPPLVRRPCYVVKTKIGLRTGSFTWQIFILRKS